MMMRLPDSERSRAASEFTRLLDIMTTLLGPAGCPWDREQTIDTLKRFVLEETYEVIEAMDRHDHDALREELGDFLFQAIFIAELEREASHFSIADALQAIADKLVRRHPHVFALDQGEPPLTTAAEVRTRWDELKALEPGREKKPKTIVGGLPAALPALLRAHHIGTRAASVGFDWTQPSDVMAKMREEVGELDEVVAAGDTRDRQRAEEEMGDLLFAICQLARKLDIEPETALRKANDKFIARFEAMHHNIEQTGRQMPQMTLEDLEQEWQRVKSNGFKE
jgi:MazG family protein